MPPKNTLISFTLMLCLMAGVQAHEADAIPAAQSAQPVPAAVAPALPPLAARYDLRSHQTQTEWYLWRTDDSVETADLASGQNNIWERDGREGYAYRRVFHHDRRIIEYTPGEIRTRHTEPDWAKLAAIVSPQLLASLKRGPSRQQFGQNAVHYSGVLNGQKIELWWLEQAQLPAHLEIAGGAQAIELNLKEIHAQAPAAWPRASDERIAAYERMDAADFGDMENNPFVARVMHQDGHRHAH